MSLGEKIKNARKHKKFTRVQLSEKLGISSSYLFKIETNVHVPTFTLVVALADILEISLDSLK